MNDDLETVRKQLADAIAANEALIAENRRMRESLTEAVRFIEVQQAYKSAMTAEQVEATILSNQDMSAVSIGANSCNTLAWFNFDKARKLLGSQS